MKEKVIQLFKRYKNFRFRKNQEKLSIESSKNFGKIN